MECDTLLRTLIVANGAVLIGALYGVWLIYQKRRELNDAVRSLRKSIHRYDRRREELEEYP